MDRNQFAQISEARAILETAALRLATERGHAGLVRQWNRLVAGMREALRNKDAKQYSRFDGDFHQTLFSLAANPYLTAAGQAFSAKVAAVRNRLGAQPEHMAKSYAEHVELLALLERAEVGLAVDLLERHIRYKGESFWSVPDTARKSRWERILELSE